MDDDTDVQDTATSGGEVTEAPSRTARACPTCGIFNASEREVCRSCGVDLETGEELPWPDPDPDPDVRASAVATAPHPRRWWLAVAAILAAAGLLLLGLVVAQLGPFAPPTTVPDADFDASLYPGEPTDLVLSDIATVTFLPPQDGRGFQAARMVDDNPETAWRSDGLLDDPDQPLEIVDLFLEEPSWISALVIRNGDQVDLRAYEDISRLHRVRAIVDGGGAYIFNLLDDGRGRQAIELPEPVLSTVLRLEIIEVFPGVDGNGVGVSDIELHGWSAVGDDLDLAAERAETAPATAPSTP